MSRAGLYKWLFVAVASSSLVSCVGRARTSARIARSPVSIDFSCNAVGTSGVTTVGLVVGNQPAWVVETDDDRKLRWNVRQNVTIDSIFAKPGQQLPVEPETPNEGKTKGNPYRSKAKQGTPPNTHAFYSIALTCEPPPGPGPNPLPPVKLIIDPEMIVR